MQNRPARIAVLVFVMAFPFLMVAASPKGFAGLGSVWPLLAVEGMLLVGVAFASKERKRYAATPVEEPSFKLGHVRRGPLSATSRAGVSAR